MEQMTSSATAEGEAEISEPGKELEAWGETPEAKKEEGPPIQGLGIAMIGFVIAAWGAMCGIGGGLFAVPCLHYLYKLPMKQAVVTSLSLVAATTISATLAEFLRADSRIEWLVVAALVVGSLAGAQVGFRVAKHLEPRRLKLIFCVLLLFVGTRLLGWMPESIAASGEPQVDVVLDWTDYATALLIGMGGGFVAPMLGIGGGLVAAPALLFALPGIGHLGARACSLAMGAVASTRSMVLYYRAGQLNLRRSASFAAGAALGAFVGVQIVHIPGVADVAKKMLAGTLLLVAARFAWDLTRKAEPAKD